MTRKLAVLTAFLALTGAGVAHAGPSGGAVQVSLTVVAKCATLSGADAKGVEIETRCTAGDFAQIQENTEQPKDATYATFTEDQDAHQVVTVSF